MYILRFPLHLNQIISWQIGSNSAFFRTTKRPQSPIKCQPARQTLTRPKYILTMACNNFIDCSRTASSCFPPSTSRCSSWTLWEAYLKHFPFSTHRQQKPFPLCCYCLPACLSVCPSKRTYQIRRRSASIYHLFHPLTPSSCVKNSSKTRERATLLPLELFVGDIMISIYHPL